MLDSADYFLPKTSMNTGSSHSSSRLLQLRERVDTPKNRYWAKWLLGSFAVLILLGFFVLPPILKNVLTTQLSEILHREVTIEAIEVNPLQLAVRVSGVSVRRKAGEGQTAGQAAEQAGFDELYINLSAASLFKMAAVVDALKLTHPRLAVTRHADGRFDVSDLLDVWLAPDDSPPGPTPRFSLNNIEITAGDLRFNDEQHGKAHRIDQLHLGLPFISSLPYQAKIEVQPLFAAYINGAPLRLEGESRPFAQDRHSQIDLRLDAFDLGGVHAYLPENFPLRLPSATLDSRVQAVFRELPGGVNSLVLSGQLALNGVKLTDAADAPLIAWQKMQLDLEEIDLFNQRFAVRQLTFDGLEVDAAVDRAGELNFLRLLDRLQAAPQENTVAAAPAGALVKEGAPAGGAEAGKKNAASQEKHQEKTQEKASETPPLRWSLGGLALNNAQLRWQDASNAAPVSGSVRSLNLRLGALDQALEKLQLESLTAEIDFAEALRARQLAVDGVVLDLPGLRAEIAAVRLEGARLALLRDAQGLLHWLNPPQLKAGKKTAEKPADKTADKTAKIAPWRAQLARLEVADLALRFEDRSVNPSAVQKIDQLQLVAEKLGNLPKEEARLQMKAQLNDKGQLEINGGLQVEPLAGKLQLKTTGVPIDVLQGYIDPHLNAALQRGQFSNSGELLFSLDEQTGKDALKLAYRGSATLGNLLLVDKENKSDFLKWKSLHVGGIDFRLTPLAIDIGEIALTDFFSRLILNANGRLNLADILRQKETPAAPLENPASGTPAEEKNTTPAVAEAPAAPPLPIKIGKITLNNGTVNFSDYFVKPNYTVNIGKLSGRVTGLSAQAGTLADMELRGNYGAGAPVLITAQLNPLAAKSFLDLKAEVKGVDLTGFSPYAGKYAGYLIEKGKLSLDVAYKLENQKLSAENHLFIDQFNFGEKTDSPDATSLPVKLAIALLRNNRGEIDIRLPIAGSLDDPQFSIGGLVIKVIVNLFVKAVTSPFALLGSMFGDGEELSSISFEPGRRRIDAPAQKKLEALAKALQERDGLKLDITGYADAESEREGIKRVAIERLMRREKLADLQKKGGDKNAEALELREVRIAPEEYPAYLARVYKAAKFPKPRNVIGLQKDIPAEEMERLLMANTPAEEGDLALLARQRAESVQSWLVDEGKVDPGRIFLVPPKPGQTPPAGAQAVFNLH